MDKTKKKQDFQRRQSVYKDMLKTLNNFGAKAASVSSQYGGKSGENSEEEGENLDYHRQRTKELEDEIAELRSMIKNGCSDKEVV